MNYLRGKSNVSFVTKLFTCKQIKQLKWSHLLIVMTSPKGCLLCLPPTYGITRSWTSYLVSSWIVQKEIQICEIWGFYYSCLSISHPIPTQETLGRSEILDRSEIFQKLLAHTETSENAYIPILRTRKNVRSLGWALNGSHDWVTWLKICHRFRISPFSQSTL